VEEVLQDHPAIQDVGVAGVPDPKRGEIVKTWIVLAEGQSLDKEELKTWAKERMAKYKIPSEIEFRDELPKTHVGKLLRRELVREHKEELGG
jgi:long-chain acyl-CoA synthetase